jgi:hypothetical protein
MAIPIYYELHDLLNQGAEKQGVLVDIDDDIADAIHRGLAKYQKYYTFMDETDAYYTALILDPRMKGDLLLRELSGDGARQMIIDTTRENMRQKYHYDSIEEDSISSIDSILLEGHDDPEVRMLRRLAPITRKVAGSDIDEYFTTPRIDIKPSGDREWLVKWWGDRRDSMPQMAAAARDYLAIPASEVSVERLFSAGRDLIKIRRTSLNGETMRMLMLMDDIMQCWGLLKVGRASPR